MGSARTTILSELHSFPIAPDGMLGTQARARVVKVEVVQ